jgi:peptide deformylase
MQLKFAYYGHPILRKKAAPVEMIDEHIKELVRDMIETMLAHNGLGLAAPQVHRSLAILLTNVPFKDKEGNVVTGKPKVFINPKILEYSEENWTHSEGCLSIPKIYGDVERPIKVKVEATNLKNEKFIVELYEWDARVFLHENDHLNGVLFIDRMRGKARKELDPLLRDIKKKYNP